MITPLLSRMCCKIDTVSIGLVTLPVTELSRGWAHSIALQKDICSYNLLNNRSLDV